MLGADPRTEHRLAAVGYDTPGHHLHADGVTLRRRAGGPDAGWHLKLPAGQDRREELRLPLTASTTPPAELLAIVRASSRGGALAPVTEIDTVRTVWVGPGAPGLELADDRVAAHTTGAEVGRWREIELELGPGRSRRP